MKQDATDPYRFYTVHGEHITILVTATDTYPLVEGFGPPTFYGHPVDPTTNTRLFQFTEANPPDSDAVELVFGFGDPAANASYDVQVSGSDGGSFGIPTIIQVPGLTMQHLGLLFRAE